MADFFAQVNPLYLALIAAAFTWGVTALGAAAVFFFRSVNKNILNTMSGFAAGVMLAASFWSLLAPALELSESIHKITWLAPALGFIAGGLFVLGSSILLDRVLKKDENTLKRKRGALLVMSITLHNIPEGLCVGVAFGALALNIQGADLTGALMLALGIGLQNFPEGAAVSLPMRADGATRRKAFLFGQASGAVEPIACVLGYFLAASVKSLLPLSLGFSAGAMVAVAAGELLPQASESKNFSVVGCISGFVIMMILDVALG